MTLIRQHPVLNDSISGKELISCAGYIDRLHELDTINLAWSDLGDLGRLGRPTARGYHGFEPIGNKIYTFGGRSTLGKYALFPNKSSWTEFVLRSKQVSLRTCMCINQMFENGWI